MYKTYKQNKVTHQRDSYSKPNNKTLNLLGDSFSEHINVCILCIMIYITFLIKKSKLSLSFTQLGNSRFGWVYKDAKKTIETKYYRDIRITVYNRGIWYFQVGSEKIAPCIFNLSLFLHLSNLL